MTKQEIASLAVKLITLYIVVNAVVSTSLETIPYIQQQAFAAAQGTGVGFDSFQNMFAREALSLLFPLLVALILWKISNWLGARMVKDIKPQTHHPKQPMTAQELQTIIISVIGLFVAISSIPQFVIFFMALSMPSIPGSNFTTVFLQLLNPLLSVLIGWFLLFNASAITRNLQKRD